MRTTSLFKDLRKGKHGGRRGISSQCILFQEQEKGEEEQNILHDENELTAASFFVIVLSAFKTEGQKEEVRVKKRGHVDSSTTLIFMQCFVAGPQIICVFYQFVCQCLYQGTEELWMTRVGIWLYA